MEYSTLLLGLCIWRLRQFLCVSGSDAVSCSQKPVNRKIQAQKSCILFTSFSDTFVIKQFVEVCQSAAGLLKNTFFFFFILELESVSSEQRGSSQGALVTYNQLVMVVVKPWPIAQPYAAVHSLTLVGWGRESEGQKNIYE